MCVSKRTSPLIYKQLLLWISEVLLIDCGGKNLRTWGYCCIWSLLVPNVSDYFSYLIILWYPWARNCVSVSIHFPRFHLKWVPVTPFFPIPLEILSLLKQSQGLTMVSLDRMNNWWWFGFVLHNHLRWLNQATRVLYSFKKYICGHPTGMVAIAFQSLRTCSLMTAAARVLRPPWCQLFIPGPRRELIDLYR